MSEPKLNIKEETSAKKTRSPPKRAKVEQSVPKKKKLKTDADKAAEKAQHLRFGKAELTPDELSRLSKAQKREMYAAHAARSAVHREVDQYEDDNVGTQALSEGEKAAGNVRDISKSRYARKLKKKAKMQGKKGSKTAKSSASEPTAAQDAGASGTGEGGSNWLSRWKQRQEIHKSYYAAARSGTAAQTAGGKAASNGASATRSSMEQAVEKGKTAVSTAVKGLANAAKSNAHVLVIVGVFILLIHNADTEAKKAALFSKVRSGDVRVLLGSTAKMGAGTNVQSRLVAVHHLDVGWKPSDMTQRNGRIIRQGNMNKEVKVFNYVTEGTFDSYLFQTLENKQRFISQIMTSKSPVRSCEDVDEQALSYAEIKALCAGNPLIKEKMDLDVQVAKLKVLKADHQSQKFRLQDKLLTKFPADIQETNAHIAGLKADAQLAATHPQGKEEFCGMVIKGVAYDEKKTAGERLVLACSELPNAEEKVIGSYRGFELSLRFDTFRSEYQALLKGQRKYTVPLGTDPLGNIIRLDNSLNNFPERITAAENELDTLHQQQAAAQIEVEKPFPQEEELAEKSARLAELNAQLDVDEKSHEPEQDEEEQEDPPRRPSVLAALEEKSDKPEPVKPFRSYYDKDGDAR